MGTGFGGMGVTSMIVTDLDQDSQPELLYTYSFGSGIHQSHLGLYSPALTGNSTIEATTRYVDGDLLLVKVDDQRVNIKAAGADPLVEALTIGHPALVSEGGQARLFLQLNAKSTLGSCEPHRGKCQADRHTRHVSISHSMPGHPGGNGHCNG